MANVCPPQLSHSDYEDDWEPSDEIPIPEEFYEDVAAEEDQTNPDGDEEH